MLQIAPGPVDNLGCSLLPLDHPARLEHAEPMPLSAQEESAVEVLADGAGKDVPLGGVKWNAKVSIMGN